MRLKKENWISASVGRRVTRRLLSSTVPGRLKPQTSIPVYPYVCAIPSTLYNGRELASALYVKVIRDCGGGAGVKEDRVQ